MLPNIQTDVIKAGRQFSIDLILSVQPAVTTHLRDNSLSPPLSTVRPYLNTAILAMVRMETVVEREMPTALRTK